MTAAVQAIVDRLSKSPAEQYVEAHRMFLNPDSPPFHRATAFCYLWRLRHGNERPQG